MKSRPAFIAALPREIAPLVNRLADHWRCNVAQRRRGIYLYWNDRAIVACAGMGAHRAALATEAALGAGPVSSLTSIGWAGACDHSLAVGAVVEPGLVIDAGTGERFGSGARPVLVTVPIPAGVAEKSRLAESYSAALVDMEAAAVARLALARNIPFCALKAISDDADFELLDMVRFVSATGQFREAAFGLYVALRPWRWSSVLKMTQSSKLAAENLAIAIRRRIETPTEEGHDGGFSDEK